MPCLWNRVGLLGHQSIGICAIALSATFRHWEMKGILFLIAWKFPKLAASPGRYAKMLSDIAWQPFQSWLLTPTKMRPHEPMLAEWNSSPRSASEVCMGQADASE